MYMTDHLRYLLSSRCFTILFDRKFTIYRLNGTNLLTWELEKLIFLNIIVKLPINHLSQMKMDKHLMYYNKLRCKIIYKRPKSHLSIHHLLSARCLLRLFFIVRKLEMHGCKPIKTFKCLTPPNIYLEIVSWILT